MLPPSVHRHARPPELPIPRHQPKTRTSSALPANGTTSFLAITCAQSAAAARQATPKSTTGATLPTTSAPRATLTHCNQDTGNVQAACAKTQHDRPRSSRSVPLRVCAVPAARTRKHPTSPVAAPATSSTWTSLNHATQPDSCRDYAKTAASHRSKTASDNAPFASPKTPTEHEGHHIPSPASAPGVNTPMPTLILGSSPAHPVGAPTATWRQKPARHAWPKDYASSVGLNPKGPELIPGRAAP